MSRNSIRCLTLLLALASFAAPAIALGDIVSTGTLDRVLRETTESLAAAGDYATVKKAELQKRFESELNTIDKRIVDLKEQASVASETARVTLTEYIPDLEKRKADLELKLEDLKNRSGKAWDDMATGTESALKELKKSYDKAKSRFE